MIVEWTTQPLFSDHSRDFAMVTNYGSKIGKIAIPHIHSAHWHSKMDYRIATMMCVLTAKINPLYCVEI